MGRWERFLEVDECAIQRVAFFLVVVIGLLATGHRKIDNKNKQIEEKDNRIGNLTTLVDSLTNSPAFVLRELGYEYFGGVLVSGYTSSKDETDNTPYLCEGSGYSLDTLRDYKKVVACNSLEFGTILYIVGVGEVKVVDRLHERFDDRIDLYFGSKNNKKEAKKFGIPVKEVFIKKEVRDG